MTGLQLKFYTFYHIVFLINTILNRSELSKNKQTLPTFMTIYFIFIKIFFTNTTKNTCFCLSGLYTPSPWSMFAVKYTAFNFSSFNISNKEFKLNLRIY